jgi:hypothetical protein
MDEEIKIISYYIDYYIDSKEYNKYKEKYPNWFKYYEYLIENIFKCNYIINNEIIINKNNVKENEKIIMWFNINKLHYDIII